MKSYIFGYGSLVNLVSASRTLKRDLSNKDVYIAKLNQYQRNWFLWDNVYSEQLQNQVKGVFLNISYSKNDYLNGLIFEISDEELDYFKLREKNYNCVNVTELVEIENFNLNEKCKILTFAGKKDYLLDVDFENAYIFERYIEIVHTGVAQFGKVFQEEFEKTTIQSKIPQIPGSYIFIDKQQQTAR
ncbi:hypothetical protein [Runella limosa]|uniref:hypothetical protein n=1 Tax=Runella limosa TaxID=370978 RepID=UPI0003FC047A|nr:hypothetical protein [Runella limosa]